MTYKQLYRFCMQFYPSRFRHEFGDEMLEVFTERMINTNGGWEKTSVIIKEVADALWNAIVMHSQETKQWYGSLSDDFRMLYQARWIVRIASFLNALFFVLATLQSYTQQPTLENLALLVLFGIQLVCVLFALRWDRAGGIIMLTATLTIALIIFHSTAFPGLELFALLGTVLWAIPFSGFAFGYLVIGQRQVAIQRRVIS